jgi:dipeptidase E
LNLEAELVDLRNYFNKEKDLEKKLDKKGIIFVRGGNTFVLRQAMKLSGFDNIIKKLAKKEDFLYIAYSAGICILAPTLKGIDLMDDITKNSYGKKSKVIWKGLGIINYSIVPHYKSNHPESENANKSVEYLKKHNLPFKALRDGEVIIVE